MVAADDEVRDAVVLADDPVPHGLARPAHAHRQRQQRQRRRPVRVARHDALVAADPGVVVDVAGLRETHDRMDQQIGLHLFGGAERELEVRAMQRVARLEGDDLAPPQQREVLAQLRGRVPEIAVVVVQRRLQAFDLAADIEPARSV